MCGIAGFLRFKDFDADPSELAQSMADALEHRGPDAGDIWCHQHVALAHRRLSILDLSPTGAQPMHSASGRYVIVYNGELYGYQSLQRKLAASGCTFKGTSDTEVLLALLERDGIDGLSLINGMFAFAVWDKDTQTLHLVRDRLGKKPLYVYECDGQVAFASEIKSLLRLPGIDRTLRADAIRDFFAFQYVPDPKTVFARIHKLSPGHWLRFTADARTEHTWWDVSFATHHTGSEDDIQDELYSLIEDSVQSRMISDVPLGAFLSGGVDSSAIVGMMAQASNEPVTTCSVGFDSKRYDELEHAARIAERFSTDHHASRLDATFVDQLPAIAAWFDEPFADPSFLPTFHVSREARKRVTVALSGDGGDECFAGYEKYAQDAVEGTYRDRIPAPLKPLLPALRHVATALPGRAPRRASSLLGSLVADAETAFYYSNRFFDDDLWALLVNPVFSDQLTDYDPADTVRAWYRNCDSDDHLARVLYTDLKTWLPGDILVKVDRMSMANSLEARAPLLDYRLVEFAATLPSRLKLAGGDKKHILKRTLKRLLPDETLYRAKMGFSIPLADWLRQDFKSLFEQTVFSHDAGLAEFFRMDQVQRLWESHQNKKIDASQELWSMFMFELWWSRYVLDIPVEESPGARVAA